MILLRFVIGWFFLFDSWLLLNLCLVSEKLLLSVLLLLGHFLLFLVCLHSVEINIVAPSE